MPFDALVQVPITADTDDDALAQLGIVPVPPMLVSEHMRQVIEDYRRSGHTAALRVRTGNARWESIELHDVRCDLAKSLIAYTRDRSATPRKLRALAAHVQHHVQDSKFILSYFDTDPILHVSYQHKVACLGIWDHGQIVHIAEWQRHGWRSWLQSALSRL